MSENKISAEEQKKLDLIKIQQKIDKGYELTPEEIYLYNNTLEEKKQASIEEQNKQIKEELLKRKAEQQELKKEFAKASDNQKLTGKERGIRIQGKGGKLKQFLWKRKIKKAVKKGGSLILKSYKDSSLELVFSKKPVRYVEFRGKTEQGEETNYITRITKTKHRLQGSSVPLHVCLEGIAENMNLYEGAETNLSADYVNKWGSGLFHSGILKGMAMKEQAGLKGTMENAIPILLFINIAVMIIVIYLMFEMWGIVADIAAIVGVA
jgi:hypothetical protein